MLVPDTLGSAQIDRLVDLCGTVFTEHRATAAVEMEPILDEFLHASLAEQIGRSPAIWWMPRLSPAVGNSDAKARRAVALCIFQFASRIWEAYQNPQILVLPQASANDAKFWDNFRVSREGFVLQRDAKNYRFSLGDYGSENKGEHCFLMTLGVDMPRVGALPVDFSLPVNQHEPSFKLIEWMAMALKLACARRRVSELSLPASADDCRMDTALEQWYGRKAGVFPNDPLGTLPGDTRKATESMAIGGLRRSQRSIGKLSEVAARGQELGTWIDSYLDGHRDVKEMLCGLMRAGRDVTHTCAPRSSPPREWVGPCEACRLDKHVDEFRLALGKRLDADDLEPVSGLDGVSTALRPGLLRAWRKFSNDPDDQVEEWLYRGGPCGILRRPADRGIFPVNDYEVENIQDPNALLSGTELDFATILADDAKAYEEMERFVDKGYVLKFGSLEEARSYVGGTIAPSRLMLLEKVKPDGKVKLRVILNCKQSGVSAVSHNAEKVILPRPLDVVFDAMELMAEHEGREDSMAEFAVIDFTEAFWQIPVSPCERRFFVVILRGIYYVIARATQGSRGGPLLWGRTAAMITRFAQAVCDPAVLRLNTYVDDPIMALHGTETRRDAAICKVLLVWLALGFSLAWKKAQRGASVVWTSARITAERGQIRATIKEELMDGVSSGTRRLLGANVVSERELRSFIGKATHVASLLYGWLPFVAMLWRPTAEPGSGKCPPGCVWARQVRIPLLWIEAFLAGKRGCSSRLFTLDGFLGRGDDVQMTFDASPWGLGGVLEVDGTIVSFFGDEFTAAEADLLKIEHGSAKSQQCVEALAILVGLRIWAPRWADRRIRLAVRSDSVSALTMVMFARASGPSVATVSREIALDIAENVYRPTVVAHLPGVMNVTADKLSRLHAPGSDGKVPSHLDADCRAFPPSRIQGFYRALGVEWRDEQIMCDPPENKS